MPIIDVTFVLASSDAAPSNAVQRIANALGTALGLSPGHLWVRLHVLPAACYAENDTALGATDLPVFVTVLHARPPTGSDRSEEAARVGQIVATVLDHDPERVHVEYAPPGAGRIAFGGSLAPGMDESR